ncbi:hypothetical protein KIN20_032613, partial [Parelaphostrongylus tenuis]
PNVLCNGLQTPLCLSEAVRPHDTIKSLGTEDDPNARKVPVDPCFDVRMTIIDFEEYLQFISRTCFSHYTYRIERLGDDFFMWRDGKCRTTDIHFTVRCEFSSSRADFFTDSELIAGIQNPL